MASTTSRWDATNWKPGKVTLFNALGLGSWNVTYPKLTPQLTGATAKAEQGASTSSGGTGTATLTSTGGSASGVSAPGGSNGCTAAQTAANQKLGQQLATSFGWNSGSEWSALNSIVMSESGWCNVAQNPSSTAYGIGQFLDTTWASVGGTKTSSAQTQIQLMLLYIKMRYGTPSKAWAFHQANNWY